MQLHPPLRKNELKEDKILGKILDVLSNVSSSKVCQLHEVFFYLLIYLLAILMKLPSVLQHCWLGIRRASGLLKN